MPKITQLRCGSTGRFDNMSQVTKFKSGSIEMLGKLPKIIQLKCGSTERSGNLAKITQLKTGGTEMMEICLRSQSSDIEAERS